MRRLWNEECDLVFRYYLPLIKQLYEKFSGKLSKPGQPKFMSMEELNAMLLNAGVCDEFFGQREIGIQFNLAMMTQVNEYEQERHIRMSLTEFIDVFGRVADKLSFDPNNEESGLEEMQALKDEGMRVRVKKGHLAYKVERLCKRMLNYVVGESAKKEFIKAKSKKK